MFISKYGAPAHKAELPKQSPLSVLVQNNEAYSPLKDPAREPQEEQAKENKLISQVHNKYSSGRKFGGELGLFTEESPTRNTLLLSQPRVNTAGR